MEDVNRSSEMIQGLQECEQLDLSRWMENLPSRLHDIRLNCLAIPGSHDSFTFFLDPCGSVAPDAPPWMQRVANLGCCAKRIIYNWASVQTLGVTDQLSSGIRYFDIRIATKSDAPNQLGTHSECEDMQLFCVHGLYGPSVDECLKSVASYLKGHRKEIVILDFNHFHEVHDADHRCLIEKIKQRFDSKLCPFKFRDNISLKFMWDKGYQLIVFYKYKPKRSEELLWPGNHIQSPWQNTDNISQLLDKLESNYKKGRLKEKEKFYVTQGILTPSAKFIVTHLCSTIKETLAKTAVGPFLDWIRGKAIGNNGLNICIIDCVEIAGFTAAVVCMNYLHQDPKTE